MDDILIQKRQLESIYAAASMAPVFKQNPKYCVGKFDNVTAYVAYNDIMENKYIIRARQLSENNTFDTTERETIVEYNSIDKLVNDGWRSD